MGRRKEEKSNRKHSHEEFETNFLFVIWLFLE